MAKAGPARRRVLRRHQRQVQRTALLGSGRRFEAVARSAAAGGARDPEAVAAAIGRKKYGKANMARLAAAGRRRSVRRLQVATGTYQEKRLTGR